MMTAKYYLFYPFRHALVSVLLLTFVTSFTTAQEISRKETIAYLNQKMGEKYVFKDKKSFVQVSVFKNGEAIREDKLFLDDLDPDLIAFSEEEKAIIVRCRSKVPDCIERKILHLKKLNNYSRIAFLAAEKDEKSIKGIEQALIHLIKLSLYSDHKRTEPFE